MTPALLPGDEDARLASLRDRWRFWPAVVALLGGLLLTALAASIAYELAVRGEEERFAARAERVSAAIAQRLRNDAAVMDAAAALWTPQRAPSVPEWEALFKKQSAGSRNRELLGLGFVDVVARADLPEFVARGQREYGDFFRVRPEPKGGVAYPIRMVAPEEIARAGVGFDIASTERRRTTAERARDEGQPVMSPPMNFDGRELNVIVYRPVYRAGLPLGTVEQRRAAHLGWIYALIRVADLVGQAPFDAATRFELYDGAVTDSTRLYAANAATPPLPFATQRRMALLGRIWIAAMEGSPDERIVRRETEMVLVAGVPITILLVVMVFVLNSTRRRALAIAAGMTRGLRDNAARLHAAEQELRASQERLQSLVENADDVIYRADARGRFTFVNAIASRVTGYERERLIGMSYLSLVRPDYRDAVKHFYELQHLDKAANSYLEFPILAADGRELWLGQKVQPVFENGEIAGYHGLARDITDRMRLKDELVLARDAALQSATLKSQFLATMSHEIRTPMNGVIGMLGLLLETQLTNEQRDIATTVQSSADSLLTIINDILDYSKIEAGKLIFESNEFDLVEAIDGSVDLLSEQARAKSLHIAVIVGEDVPTLLRGDAGRLRQVLINLIGNAIKFTDAGAIVVSAAAESESESSVVVRFTISDTGIGIEPEMIQRLFKPFVQADGSMARRFGGTGLGLAICNQLVEQMNGTIGVESEPGRGSTFWFTAELEKQAAQEEEDAVGAEGPPPAETEPAAPARRLRVLVAEDNRVNQKVVVAQLRKLGHTAVAVGNGLEALAALDEIDYDAVLMDCQMPEMDGYEAATIIRGRRRYKKVPIIAMTANAMAGDRERCIAAGMDHYIAKPFKVEQLAEVLSRVAQPRDEGAPPAPGPGVLDESVIDELRSIGGSDPEFLATVIGLYLDDAPGHMNALGRAVAGGDAEGMWRAAHAFKGACANVGARRLVELCAAIEKEGRSGRTHGVRVMFDALESELRDAVAALEQLSSEARA